MGKKDVKNDNRHQQPEDKNSASNIDHAKSREQPVSHDSSTRHLSEIDRREGEMNHGETGGNFRHFDEPDRA